MRRLLLLLSMGVVFLVWTALGSAFAATTQGQLAADLGQRLGACDGNIAKACDGKNPVACIAALRAAGIEPPGGWKPGQPVNSADLADLTEDLIEASKAGKISCTPQQAVNALANVSAAAGLGVWDIVAAAAGLGYYFPPTPPGGGGGGGGVVVSPSK